MRGPRISYSGAIHHVINRFVDKHPFFTHKSDYEDFLETYFEIAGKFKIDTYAYCLMNNHFHILLEIPDERISRFLQIFLTTIAKQLNRKKNRVGHLFQGRSKTLLVEKEKYFSTVFSYVLFNPVRAGICKSLFDYKWNSIREMQLNKENSRISKEKSCHYLFNSEYDDKEFDIKIKKWLMNIEYEKIEEDFKKNHKGSFISTLEFKEQILKKIERRKKETKNLKEKRKTDRISIKPGLKNLKGKIKILLESNKKEWKILWRNIDKAREQIYWYILHDIYYKTWEEIREEEKMPGINLSRLSQAVSTLRKNKTKMVIVNKILSSYKNIESGKLAE